MLFYIRNRELRAKAKDEFIRDCERVSAGRCANRALETDIYVTNACNLRCAYCYFYFEPYFADASHHKPENPTLTALKVQLDKISGRTYCLVILGGEPFSRPDFEQLLAYARGRDIFSLRVSTNGLLLRRSKHLLQYIDTLAVSFDAMRKAQYPREAKQVLDDLSQLKAELGGSLPRIVPSWTTAPADDFDKDVRPLLDYSVEHGFVVKFLPLKVNQKADWKQQRTIVLQALEYVGQEAVTNQLDHTLQLGEAFGTQNCLVAKTQHYIDFEGNFLYPCDEYAHQRVGTLYSRDIDTLYDLGAAKFGTYPRSDGVCAHCPSGCHSDNSYIIRNPARQIAWLE